MVKTKQLNVDVDQIEWVATDHMGVSCSKLPEFWRSNKKFPIPFTVKFDGQHAYPNGTHVYLTASNHKNRNPELKNNKTFIENGLAIFNDFRFVGRSGRDTKFDVYINVDTNPSQTFCYRGAIKVTVDGPRPPRIKLSDSMKTEQSPAVKRKICQLILSQEEAKRSRQIKSCSRHSCSSFASSSFDYSPLSVAMPFSPSSSSSSSPSSSPNTYGSIISPNSSGMDTSLMTHYGYNDAVLSPSSSSSSSECKLSSEIAHENVNELMSSSMHHMTFPSCSARLMALENEHDVGDLLARQATDMSMSSQLMAHHAEQIGMPPMPFMMPPPPRELLDSPDLIDLFYRLVWFHWSKSTAAASFGTESPIGLMNYAHHVAANSYFHDRSAFSHYVKENEPTK